jgi:hypothetical protein
MSRAANDETRQRKLEERAVRLEQVRVRNAAAREAKRAREAGGPPVASPHAAQGRSSGGGAA